jgi:hypothetical protein
LKGQAKRSIQPTSQRRRSRAKSKGEGGKEQLEHVELSGRERESTKESTRKGRESRGRKEEKIDLTEQSQIEIEEKENKRKKVLG